jgi:hypothetical protein
MNIPKHEDRKCIYFLSVIHGILKQISDLLPEDAHVRPTLEWAKEYSLDATLQAKEQGDSRRNFRWMVQTNKQWESYTTKRNADYSDIQILVPLGQELCDAMRKVPFMVEAVEPLVETFYTLGVELLPHHEDPIDKFRVATDFAEKLYYISDFNPERYLHAAN